MKDKVDTMDKNDISTILAQEKDSAYEYRKRRHSDWEQNYQLYRNKVNTNRITQRQSAPIPLMRYGIDTVMKDIDDPYRVRFYDLEGEELREKMYNFAFEEFLKNSKDGLRSISLRKSSCLYGRYFRRFNHANGKMFYEKVSTEDMLVDRFMDPLDLDSARIIIQVNQFKSYDEIVTDDKYSSKVIADINRFYNADDRTAEFESNYNRYERKVDKLKAVGVKDTETPVVGTKYLEINEILRKEINKKNEIEIMYYEVIASQSGMILILQKKPLEEVIGKTKNSYWKTHYPYTSAGADADSDDVWCDGPADVIRPTNKIVDSMFSSLIENRLLRNMQMQYYDATIEGFVPQTYIPKPFAWLPVGGKPSDVVMPVNVGDLSESLDEIEYAVGITEKAVAATSAQTGEVDRKDYTLGQTQLALANARDRTKAMLKPIEQEYKDFADKYMYFLEAVADELEPLVITKQGIYGVGVFTEVVKIEDLISGSGYLSIVSPQADEQGMQIEKIQKIQIAKETMPDNPYVDEALKKGLLELSLDSELVAPALEFEREKMRNMGSEQAMLPTPQPQPQTQPQPQMGMIQ